MNFRRWCEAVQRLILLPSNSRRVDHLLLGSIDAKNHSVNFRSWCEAVRRSSCNLLFSFCSFRSSESNRCFSSPSYRNNRQVLNPLLISLKFLHVISILCKTEWWWELSTWSQKINLTDTSTNSPYNFYWKCMGTTKQNFEVLAIIKANKHQSTTIPISSSGQKAVDLFLLPTPPPPRFPLLDSLWHGKANVQNVCSRIFAGVNSQVISEFQKTVTFKTWPSAKPSLWKWVLFERE